MYKFHDNWLQTLLDANDPAPRYRNLRLPFVLSPQELLVRYLLMRDLNNELRKQKSSQAQVYVDSSTEPCHWGEPGSWSRSPMFLEQSESQLSEWETLSESSFTNSEESVSESEFTDSEESETESGFADSEFTDSEFTDSEELEPESELTDSEETESEFTDSEESESQLSEWDTLSESSYTNSEESVSEFTDSESDSGFTESESESNECERPLQQ